MIFNLLANERLSVPGIVRFVKIKVSSGPVEIVNYTGHGKDRTERIELNQGEGYIFSQDYDGFHILSKTGQSIEVKFGLGGIIDDTIAGTVNAVPLGGIANQENPPVMLSEARERELAGEAYYRQTCVTVDQTTDWPFMRVHNDVGSGVEISIMSITASLDADGRFTLSRNDVQTGNTGLGLSTKSWTVGKGRYYTSAAASDPTTTNILDERPVRANVREEFIDSHNYVLSEGMGIMLVCHAGLAVPPNKRACFRFEWIEKPVL